MKIYFDIAFKSFGIERAVFNLGKYLPANFERVSSQEEADLVVLHVIGRHNHVTVRAEQIAAAGKQYAVIQYALESTRNPDPSDWLTLWNNAKAVWSYYDLAIDNLYHAPLAADPQIFYKVDAKKKYTVGSNGVYFKAECIGEVHLAAWKAGGNALHIGEKFNSDPIVDYRLNVTDDELRVLYSKCKYFSALRRKDGFEIVAIEALLCGVRPIMFDTPNYRQWFDGLAEFIPEDSVGKTVGNLKTLFKNEPRPVSDEEIEETKRRFNWEKIIKGFWECTI